MQCLEFVNSDTGFVYSDWGAMRKTEDGTQTWDSSTTAFISFVYDIDFANDSVGYAGGGAWFPFANYCANTLMKTVDGGVTWDSVYGDYTNGVYNSLEVLSPNDFFAVGEGWAIHSSDGGVTLDTLVVSQAANERFLRVSFLSPQHGYLLSQIYLQSQVASFQLYETVDGGNSWMMMYSDTMGYSGFSDFLFNSSGDGMLVGEKGQIRISKGSNSWTVVPLQDTAVWLHKLAMADGKVYAIGSKGRLTAQNRLYSSIDFGASWQDEAVKLDTMDYITDMSFPGGGVGYFSTYRKLYKNSSLISLAENIMPAVGIYPNPSNDFVHLDLPGNVEADVIITNSMGQLVAHWKGVDGHSQLDVSTIPSGVYFLFIQSDEGTYSSSSMVISH